jgi:single-strand DNA-binding protein
MSTRSDVSTLAPHRAARLPARIAHYCTTRPAERKENFNFGAARWRSNRTRENFSLAIADALSVVADKMLGCAKLRHYFVWYSSCIMASRSVNKVILVGHLGRDAETKFTPAGVSVTSFSVATNRRWKDQQSGEWKEETDWANVVLWRQENLANYLTKGKQVYVEGRLQTRSFDDKDGKKQYRTEVVAEDVILLGGRGGEGMDEGRGGGRPVSMPRGASRPAAVAEPMDQGITDDDVPF